LWRPSLRSCHRLLTMTRSVWQGPLLFQYFMLYGRVMGSTVL
jgi:hypothetical protein